MRIAPIALIAAILASAASAAPTKQQVEKWGVYATLAESGWWSTADRKVQRYRWLVPGEKISLEIFEADGTPNFNATLRIEGRKFINEGLATAQITASGPLFIEFGPDNRIELDAEQGVITHSYLSAGKKTEQTSSSIPSPLFPSAELKARLGGKELCPPTTVALEKMLASVGAKKTQDEDPAVVVDGLILGGYAGERSYATSSFRILEVRPNTVTAATSGGKPFDLVAMLPGYDARRYEPAFRAAFPRGRVYCTKYGCSWTVREDSWNAPMGSLIEVSTSQTIMSETETRFRCSYR